MNEEQLASLAVVAKVGGQVASFLQYSIFADGEVKTFQQPLTLLTPEAVANALTKIKAEIALSCLKS